MGKGGGERVLKLFKNSLKNSTVWVETKAVVSQPEVWDPMRGRSMSLRDHEMFTGVKDNKNNIQLHKPVEIIFRQSLKQTGE